MPDKVCTFDCIYCQVAKTANKTIRRFDYVNISDIKKELAGILKKYPKIDYITFSGRGEPTLHKNLDKIIKAIKKFTNNKYPVCVITNSSLLYRKVVRRELQKADVIIPSLDAACSAKFLKVNRPHKKINYGKIIKGLIELRKEFKGEIRLEIMAVASINDSSEEAYKFKKLISLIKPDKIYLNLPIRPCARKVAIPSLRKLQKLKKIIGSDTDIVISTHKSEGKRDMNVSKDDITRYLKRRPETVTGVSNSLKISLRDTASCLETLVKQKKMIKYNQRGKTYFFSK
ncbi:MAG: radical SAM protein [Candidatus Omnitrophota bacterium]